ncbi:MAG: Methicillin resistance protein [Modestobacter sp.]|nr:Methicillin resistance protein [Modestobacter sp.]
MTAALPTAQATVTLEPTGDPVRWAAAAQASGQPMTPFSNHGFLGLASGMTGTEFVPLVVRADGVDVGIAPWLARRRGPVTTVNAVPFPYTGPLVPAHLMAGTLVALRRRGRRERAVRQDFGLAPTTAVDAVDLTGTGFEARLDHTYLVDTSRTEEELYGALTAPARTSLRRIERDGVAVVPSGHDGQTLGRVVDAAGTARGLDPGYGAGFPPPIGALEATGLGVHWTVAKRDDVELGSLLSISSGEVVVLWQGGLLPEHRATRANVLLYWDAVLWAHRHGARTVDLAGVPDAGVARFKSQFGGTLYSYPRLQWAAPGLRPVAGVARTVVTTLRR